MKSCIPSLRLLSSLLESLPVSPLVAAVLAAVVENPGKSQKEYLQEELKDMPRNHLSVYIKRLEESQLVVRAADPRDGRSSLYFPSQAGRQLYESLKDGLEEVGMFLAEKSERSLL